MTAGATGLAVRPERREATVAVSLVLDILGYLESKGHGRAAVCREAGISPATLTAPSERVPGSRVEALWGVGERRTGDSDLGIHTAESFNPGALDIVGYVVLSCQSAGDALLRLARYASLLNDGLRVAVERDRGRTICRHDAVEGIDNYLLRSPRQAMEAMAVGVTLSVAGMTGIRIPPLEVSFQHVAPNSTAEHGRVFGLVPRFGQAVNRVVFDSGDLARPVLSANAGLLEVFERHADALLARTAAAGTVSGQVVRRIADRLTGSVPPLGEIASDLAMSGRSLQRALQQEGTSYQALLDDVRHEMAVQQLALPGRATAEVAFLLGFSELSAFYRAFKRWTGTTPAAHRVSTGRSQTN